MEKRVYRVEPISRALEQANAPLSPVVRAGDFVFVSGMPPIDPETGQIVSGDMAKQTEVVLGNIKLALEAAGSSLDQVVKTTVFVSNAAYFPTVNEIYRKFFPHEPPARTFVCVGSWPFPFDIEIECIAIG